MTGSTNATGERGFPLFDSDCSNKQALINLPPGVLRAIVVGEGKRVARVIRKMQ